MDPCTHIQLSLCMEHMEEIEAADDGRRSRTTAAGLAALAIVEQARYRYPDGTSDSAIFVQELDRASKE